MELRYLTSPPTTAYAQERAYQHAAEHAAFLTNQWLRNLTLTQLVELIQAATPSLHTLTNKHASLEICLQPNPFGSVQAAHASSVTAPARTHRRNLLDDQSLKQLVYQDQALSLEKPPQDDPELRAKFIQLVASAPCLQLKATGWCFDHQVELVRTLELSPANLEAVLVAAERNLNLVENYLGSKRQRAPGQNNYDCLVQALIDEPLAQRLEQLGVRVNHDQGRVYQRTAANPKQELALLAHQAYIDALVPGYSQAQSAFSAQMQLVNQVLGNKFVSDQAGNISFVASQAYGTFVAQHLQSLGKAIEALPADHKLKALRPKLASVLLPFLSWRQQPALKLEKKNRHLHKQAAQTQRWQAALANLAEVATALKLDLKDQAELNQLVDALLTLSNQLEAQALSLPVTCSYKVLHRPAALKQPTTKNWQPGQLVEVSTCGQTELYRDPVLICDDLILRKHLGISLATEASALLRLALS